MIKELESQFLHIQKSILIPWICTL